MTELRIKPVSREVRAVLRRGHGLERRAGELAHGLDSAGYRLLSIAAQLRSRVTYRQLLATAELRGGSLPVVPSRIEDELIDVKHELVEAHAAVVALQNDLVEVFAQLEAAAKQDEADG